jgi:hypothetical protein
MAEKALCEAIENAPLDDRKPSARRQKGKKEK